MRHSTTIGNKGSQDEGCPVVGNNVNIGCNVVIIGDICIGDNVVIGAGSVVVNDAIVAGVPAKVIKQREIK